MTNNNDPKEILKKLLSTLFDKSLTLLEANSKDHLATIKSSIAMANSVSKECIDISKRIKIPSINHKSLNSSKQASLNGPYNKYNAGRSRMKSTRNLPKSKSMGRLLDTPTRDKSLFSSKSNFNILQRKIKPTLRTAKSQYHLKPINKSRKNSKVMDHNNKIKLDRVNSIHAKKNYNYNYTVYNTNNISNDQKPLSKKNSNPNLKQIYNKKNNNIINSAAKSPMIKSKKRSIKGSNDNKEIKSIKNKNFNDGMIFMESNLQTNFNFNEDPLLVSSINDLDLNSNDQAFTSDDLDLSRGFKLSKCLNNNSLQDINIKKSYFNIEEFADDHFNLITIFLNKFELCNLMMLNKKFNFIVKNHFLSILENEKESYENKIEEMNQDETVDKNYKGNKQFIITEKRIFRAINLLNDPKLPELKKTFEESVIPSNDILREYYIYFQIINHPLSKDIFNTPIFWKKCCQYFNGAKDGKLGDLLKKNITEDIDCSDDNIYQIVHLIGKNIKKTGPDYFKGVCGTTALFSIAIISVLDYFGIFCDKKETLIQGKYYLLCNKMVKVINEKIKRVKDLVLK